MRITRSIGGVFVEGFLILLPILICYLLLGGLFDMLMALTEPLVDLLPASAFPDLWTERAVAAAALVALSFATGVAARSKLGHHAGEWIEKRFLMRFPPYDVVRSFSRRMLGSDPPDRLQPAFLRASTGQSMLCFIVEEVPGQNRAVIFVPLAPTPGIGTVQIADRDYLEPIEATFGDAVGCLFNWGAGASRLMPVRRSPGGEERAGA